MGRGEYLYERAMAMQSKQRKVQVEASTRTKVTQSNTRMVEASTPTKVAQSKQRKIASNLKTTA